MNKGAYEILKNIIQNTDQQVKLMFADGTTKTFEIDSEKLLAELDKDQNLEKEADWLADMLAGNLRIQGQRDVLRDPAGGHKSYWREAARKAVERQ